METFLPPSSLNPPSPRYLCHPTGGPAPAFSPPSPSPALPAAAPAPAGRRQRRAGGVVFLRPSPGRAGRRNRRASRRGGLRPGGQQPQEVRGTGTAPAGRRAGGDCGAACQPWPPLDRSGRAGSSSVAQPLREREPCLPLPPSARAGSVPQPATAGQRGPLSPARPPPAPPRLRPAACWGGWRGDPRCTPALQVGEAAARPLPLSGCRPRSRCAGNGCGHRAPAGCR